MVRRKSWSHMHSTASAVCILTENFGMDSQAISHVFHDASAPYKLYNLMSRIFGSSIGMSSELKHRSHERPPH